LKHYFIFYFIIKFFVKLYCILLFVCLCQGCRNLWVLSIWWHKSTQVSFCLCYLLLNIKKDRTRCLCRFVSLNGKHLMWKLQKTCYWCVRFLAEINKLNYLEILNNNILWEEKKVKVGNFLIWNTIALFGSKTVRKHYIIV